MQTSQAGREETDGHGNRLIAAIRWVAIFAMVGIGAASAIAQTPPPQAVFTVHGIERTDLPRKKQTLAIRPVAFHGRSAGKGTDAVLGEAMGPFRPNAHLRLCWPRLSNAPRADAALFVKTYKPLVIVNGKVLIAAAPVNHACLSSGFGPRFGRIHKGIDLISRRHDPIFAAAPGIVREAGWGRGYGRYVVLDHGHGVYTRYAHLERIDKRIKPGTGLGFGQPLGTMGKSGNSTGVHLHFEVLTGEWGPMKAYGLTASNPLDFPAYTPAPFRNAFTINAQLTDAIPQ